MRKRRCVICNLPDTYPGISFDECDICSVCSQDGGQTTAYSGMAALKERIRKILSQPRYADRPYDAAVAFSGGRDSTYLLHFAKNELGLNILAVTLLHRFMPQETIDAAERICHELHIDHRVITNQALNDYGAMCVKAWAERPEAASLVTFCTGCRYGIKRMIPSFCKEHGIPLLLVGNTRMEQMSYRQDLLSADPAHPTALNKVRGYLGCIARNPALLGNARCACVQAYEFSYPLIRKLIRNRQVTVLAPFRDYVEIPEEVLTTALRTLGWSRDSCFSSDWRADCYVSILRQYFYQRLLGFNDLDVHYADLIRTQRIDHHAAMIKLAAEKEYDDILISDLLEYYYGVKLEVLQGKLSEYSSDVNV